MPGKVKPLSPRNLHRIVADEEREASGRIIRLGYTLHGAVDGYHLDDGTFLHLQADDATIRDLQVGETVKATGVMIVRPDVVVLEVRTIERVVLLGKRHGSD